MARELVNNFKFYLGTGNPSWLWGKPNTHPLFVSARRIRRYKTLKPANVSWSCDSGGFTELSMFDKWVTTPEQYVDELYRMQAEIGLMDWASPQDWMCEPHMIAKTGKTVEEHQQLSCLNFVRLRQLGPDLPIIPVLQGWQPDDYRNHVDMYKSYGVELRDYSTVGLGSFCRRANVSGVRELVVDLAQDGLKLHGFGLKQDGLKLFKNHLVSSDSMAWSFTARIAGWKNVYLCGVPHVKAKNCNECHVWATMWADGVLETEQTSNLLLWET